MYYNTDFLKFCCTSNHQIFFFRLCVYSKNKDKLQNLFTHCLSYAHGLLTISFFYWGVHLLCTTDAMYQWWHTLTFYCFGQSRAYLSVSTCCCTCCRFADPILTTFYILYLFILYHCPPNTPPLPCDHWSLLLYPKFWILWDHTVEIG